MNTMILNALAYILLVFQVIILALYLQGKVDKKSIWFGLALTAPFPQAILLYFIQNA